MDDLAASIWEQVYGKRTTFFDDQDPEFGISESEKRDILWLIGVCGITSKDAFVALES
jgi:hypothetical protein